ncbi:hypothetical protein [Flavobacterium bizetiae]|uniref:hypothetical protein n=1 Tax=Flavobacterium bizetiae TaxID=2704140 RepID=UPI00174CA623|nr:hypothetical protein [Flavobacterium bizetiae]CAD5342624.1 hypothetical protein FLA105535_02612 [Flavobacterium bizetiae]CAD5348159.1 hypothetical protein FLA105534_02118 [Flavobacterium bizetiae]
MNDTITQQITDINLQIVQAEKTIKWYKGLAVFSITVGFILIIVFLILFYLEKGKEYHYLIDVGTISGGIVASLFSLAGLILVYVAFLGQKQQLLYQQIEMIYNKEELILTRNEMANQQREMQKQNETLELQKFENLFFQLLSNYQNNKMSFYTIMDLNLFQNLMTTFKKKLLENNYSFWTDDQISITAYQKSLDEVSMFETTFYYQVDSILKFIYSSNNTIDKNLYVNILKTALSKTEKVCLKLICTYDSTVLPSDKININQSGILNDVHLPVVVKEQD